MKHLLKRAVALTGFEVRRTTPPFVPYLQHYRFGNCEFDLWIANRESHEWYAEWLLPNNSQPWEWTEFLKLIRPDDHVLEIGCHHGFTSLILAQLIGPEGSLYAIDANPENVLITNAQFSQNKLSSFCTASHLAASNRSETLSMEWCTNSHVTTPNTSSSFSVPAVTGDELDSLYGPFNVLKIDVEGYEVKVLQGCQKILNRNPKLILEVHPEGMSRYGDSFDDLWPLIHPLYQGTTLTRPEWNARPFSKDSVPKIGISNLQLTVK